MKKYLLLLTALCLCAFTNKALAQSWSLNDGTLTISDNSAFPTYPSPYPWADRTGEITTLIIQSGVTTIPYDAFSDCKKLQNVCIEDSPVSLSLPQGYYYWNTFSGCPIQTIHLGRDLNPNDSPPFSGMTSLTSLTIGNDVTHIGWNYFSGCSALTEVTIPNSVLEISDGAFYGCAKLETLTIGNSVRTIGGTSFQNCKALKSVTIPKSVTQMGGNAFSDCIQLANVNIEDSPISLSLPQGYYYWNTFSGCSSIQTIHLGRDLNPNDSPPFSGMTSLTSLTIGNDVTHIGWNYFSGCSALTEVTIPNSVLEISDGAFYGCAKLETLTIGNSVRTIGGTSFQNCKALKSVTIPKSVTQIGGNAFSDCIQLANVNIEDSPISLSLPQGYYYWNTFSGCSSIQTIHLGRDLNPNDSPPFSGMTSLTSLTIGNDVTNIGREYFSGCIGLTQITSNPTTPPTLQSNTFDGVDKGISVYLSDCNYLAAYKSAQYWSDFTNYMCPPSNDQCADAASLSCGVSVQGSLAHATPTTSVIYDDGADRGDVFYKFTADMDGDYSVTLTKYNIDDDINLYVYSDCDATTPLVKLIDAEDGLIETKTLENCKAGTTYLLRAIDWSYSGGSFDILLGCDDTGINEIKNAAFSIFPNPVKDEIFIKSDLQVKKVEICDISGRIVETQNAASLQNGLQKIAVSALSQGIYIVRIYTDSGLIVSKVMKE